MNGRLLISILFAAVLALALRLPCLDQRPMHNDEAVNAIKFRELREHGQYKYDPQEYHGPTLYYATLALGHLTGAPDFDRYSESRLRLVTVLFGLGLVLLLPLLADALGRRGTAWAALFMAASPAMVFYSRYFIHEMLLVFFTLLALAAGWRYARSRRLGWIITAGAALGGMDATKETFVLTLAAAGIAAGLNHAWNRWLDASSPRLKNLRLNRAHLVIGLSAWLVVAVILYSSFFTNPSGPLDSLRTFLFMSNRAGGGSPHIHPWSFYLHRLLWFHSSHGPVFTELLLLVLAAVATWAGFARKHLDHTNAGFVRFVAFYTFLLTTIYSLVVYKTPWCLLNFWLGAVLLAGIGAAVLLRSARHVLTKWALTVLLLAGVGHLVWQAWELDTVYAADRRNPYNYSPTSPNLLELVAKLQKLAEASPQHYETLVKVMAPEGDFWPLPWYLRQFRKAGWWDQLAPDPWAPIMIVGSQFHAGFDEKQSHLMTGYYELRRGVFFELYVEKTLWEAYLAKKGRAVSEP